MSKHGSRDQERRPSRVGGPFRAAPDAFARRTRGKGWAGYCSSRPCPILGERVHSFVYVPGQTPDDAALRAHCARQLADYKVPESLTWSDTPLPRNANGKLMKRVLRAQLPGDA